MVILKRNAVNLNDEMVAGAVGLFAFLLLMAASSLSLREYHKCNYNISPDLKTFGNDWC